MCGVCVGCICVCLCVSVCVCVCLCVSVCVSVFVPCVFPPFVCMEALGGPQDLRGGCAHELHRSNQPMWLALVICFPHSSSALITLLVDELLMATMCCAHCEDIGLKRLVACGNNVLCSL